MIDRRTMMTAALTTFAGIGSTRLASAQVGMSRMTAYAFSFPALAGSDIRLAEYAGHPIIAAAAEAAEDERPAADHRDEHDRARHRGDHSVDQDIVVLDVAKLVAEDCLQLAVVQDAHDARCRGDGSMLRVAARREGVR